MIGLERRGRGDFHFDDATADREAWQLFYALKQARALQRTIELLPLAPGQRLSCARAVEHVVSGLARSVPPLRTEKR